MSLPQLPGVVQTWIDTLEGKEQGRWHWLLRRCNTDQQVLDIHEYVQRCLDEQRNLTSLFRRISYVVRLVQVLGTRDFSATTAADLALVLNAVSFRRYLPWSTQAFAAVSIPNNAYLRRSARYSIQPLLRHVYIEAGMDKVTAATMARGMLNAVPNVTLAPCTAHAMVKLTASDIAAIHQALPTMPWSRAQTMMMALWLALLSTHGPRVAGLLRSKCDAITWQGNLAYVAVPPGYLNKRTVPLFLDATTTSLLKAYLAHHPNVRDESPLFYEFPNDAPPRPLTQVEFSRRLKHLGTRAKLGYRLGLRCFRKFVATTLVTQGATNATLQRHLAHSNVGRSTYRYVQITRTELAVVMRGLSGAGVGQYSTCCRFRYAAGSDMCGYCGRRPKTSLEPDVTDAAQARRDAAGQLGLECLDDLVLHG
ncbi:MAG: tyrosine-type recombinase/integrase [Candidatus Thermoplasmatota archaeon]